MRRCLVVLLLCIGEAWSQDWADRAEYDLALTVRSESSPLARLVLLDEWKQRYPRSQAQRLARELALDAAQQLGDRARILAAARELVAQDPGHYAAAYWITILSPGAPAGGAASLREAGQAARTLLAGVGGWPRQKAEISGAARRTLGWLAWQKGDTGEAATEFAACLTAVPRHAEVSAWYGAVLTASKTPSKVVEGIWHLARASYLDGEGALSAAPRRQVLGLLEAAYGAYHGGNDGLDAIGISAARAQDAAAPPAAFRIETAAEAAQRKADEEMAANQPHLWSWVKTRRQLAGPDGMAVYEKLAGADSPLLPEWKGWVIRCDKDRRATQVVLGLQDTVTEEVVVQLESPAARCPDPGLALEFAGKPVAFTAEPFRLTVTVPLGGLRGWPEARP